MALTLLSLAGFLTAFLLPVLVRGTSLKATIFGWGVLSMVGGLLLWGWPDSGIVSGVGLMALLSTIGMAKP